MGIGWRLRQPCAFLRCQSDFLGGDILPSPFLTNWPRCARMNIKSVQSDSKDVQKKTMILEKLFTSKVRVRLLTLFISRPAEAFYIRQIARLTGETYNNVRQELQNLAQLGLTLSECRANAIYYRANVEHFLFPELKRIILKTEAVGDRLREALTALGAFGSPLSTVPRLRGPKCPPATLT